MNIVKRRRVFLGISLIIILVGIIMYFINGLNYGLEFTGGTLIEFETKEFISVEDGRSITDEFDPNVSIIHGGEDKKELIIKSTLDLSNKDINNLTQKFDDKYEINAESILSDKTGATMGKEIRNKALLSIGIATIAMLAYITFRFELKFGLAAILALIHDILITMSIYSIFQLPINSAFIAAILTIVGYSINDTIVIFDRIRGESKLDSRQDKEVLINNSIKDSLRRTINTTITTILAVFILYILGVEDIKILTLPLIVGMIAGTYSSMFLAPTFWYDLKKI